MAPWRTSSALSGQQNAPCGDRVAGGARRHPAGGFDSERKIGEGTRRPSLSPASFQTDVQSRGSFVPPDPLIDAQLGAKVKVVAAELEFFRISHSSSSRRRTS